MNRLASKRKLRLQFLDTWHVGSGRSEGRYLDAVVDLDAHGLPFVPGRMLKGLLRQAAVCLAAWGHWPSEHVDLLFGRSDEGEAELSRPGCVSVSSAVLGAAERQWLGGTGPDARALRQALFMEQFQTAIDPRTGTAAEGSLRGLQVVVPLTLEAELAVMSEPADSAGLWAHLDQLLPLVRAVGAHKTRGHGRVTLAWSGESKQ